VPASPLPLIYARHAAPGSRQTSGTPCTRGTPRRSPQGITPPGGGIPAVPPPHPLPRVGKIPPDWFGAVRAPVVVRHVGEVAGPVRGHRRQGLGGA
jgi:hypothetical protein